MADLSAFPITSRWPAAHPDRLQLYSVPTPNGVKVSIMLEETGLPYEPHFIPLGEGGTETAGIPLAQPQRQDPGDRRSRRAGRRAARPVRIGRDPDLSRREDRHAARPPARGGYETIQWVMLQMGGVGPMFGQVGFFHKFAGRELEDKRPLERYVAEAKRLLGVLEARLEGRDWIMDDYTIADIATLGWVRNLITFYEARELVDYDSLSNVPAWLERGLARPAVQRGLTIPVADREALAAQRALELLEEALRCRAFLAGLGLAELLQQLALLRAQLGRRLDLDLDHHVAMAAAVHHRHAGAALAQLLARLDAGGDLDLVLLLSRPGTSIAPPRAAVVKLTGQRANRVVPSRWKIGCRARWTKM